MEKAGITLEKEKKKEQEVLKKLNNNKQPIIKKQPAPFTSKGPI